MVKEITPKDLHEMIKKLPDDLHIVDVREKEEVEDGMIDTATWVPLGELPAHLAELKSKERVVFVCRCGHRSKEACLLLKAQGHNEVYNLTGGIVDWILSDLPTVV